MDGGTATGDAFNIYLTVGGSTAAEQNDVTEPTSSGIQDIRLLQRFDTTIFLTADDASGNPLSATPAPRPTRARSPRFSSPTTFRRPPRAARRHSTAR